MNLERALDPLRVLRRKARGGGRVDARKLGMKGGPPFARGASVVIQVGKRKFARVTVT